MSFYTSLSNQFTEILKHHALPPHRLESNLIQKWVCICLEIYYTKKKVHMKSRFVFRFCKQPAERLLSIVKNASHKKRIDLNEVPFEAVKVTNSSMRQY